MKKKPKIQNTSTKGDLPIQEIPLACADEAAAVEFIEKQREWDESVLHRDLPV